MRAKHCNKSLRLRYDCLQSCPSCETSASFRLVHTNSIYFVHSMRPSRVPLTKAENTAVKQVAQTNRMADSCQPRRSAPQLQGPVHRARSAPQAEPEPAPPYSREDAQTKAASSDEAGAGGTHTAEMVAPSLQADVGSSMSVRDFANSIDARRAWDQGRHELDF
eukprot:SAG25_NODE_194_length_12183_cov_70.943893_11_plen_164_part_00